MTDTNTQGAADDGAAAVRGNKSGTSPGRLPPLETFARGQGTIQADNMAWMDLCRELCRQRLPSGMFERVPPGVWRFHPWGHRIVIMRTPEIDQIGTIIVPPQGQQQNYSGWILSVGESVCGESKGTSLQSGSSPYSHPLLAVGELVLFNPYAGRALVMNALDEGFIHRTRIPQFLICGIGDVYGPNVDPQWFDYASEQPAAQSILLDSTGSPT